MSDQFGAFDGLDNRKAVFHLLKRLGHGVSEEVGNARRAGFLQGLLVGSTTGFAGKMITVDACGPVESYKLFVAITGCLGVNIERAAKTLEILVRYWGQDTRDDRRLTLCGA